MYALGMKKKTALPNALMSEHSVWVTNKIMQFSKGPLNIAIFKMYLLY